MPLRYIFEFSSIAELSRQVEYALGNTWESNAHSIMSISHALPLPLSFAQQRLWYIDQLVPGGAAYNMPAGVRLSGNLQVHILEQSLLEIVQRHKSLRTTFHEIDNKAVQIIGTVNTFQLCHCNLSFLKAR